MNSSNGLLFSDGATHGAEGYGSDPRYMVCSARETVFSVLGPGNVREIRTSRPSNRPTYARSAHFPLPAARLDPIGPSYRFRVMSWDLVVG